MARHKFMVSVELETTDERWSLNYGDTETPKAMGEHLDGTLVEVVRAHFERVGVADVIRSTVSTGEEPATACPGCAADIRPCPNQQHRPDDMPEPGDRCKDCMHELTWLGPGPNDWAVSCDGDQGWDSEPDVRVGVTAEQVGQLVAGVSVLVATESEIAHPDAMGVLSVRISPQR